MSYIKLNIQLKNIFIVQLNIERSDGNNCIYCKYIGLMTKQNINRKVVNPTK